mmetsp:Transcript_97252/g.270620  ORF Transcript_97252/g.270620 Transcript_97252/m.270620 type:complete len:546 (+) Transcript_97252:538-2175(+)
MVGAEERLRQHVLPLQEDLQRCAQLCGLIQDVREVVRAHQRVAEHGLQPQAGLPLPGRLQAPRDALGRAGQRLAQRAPAGLHGRESGRHPGLEALGPALVARADGLLQLPPGLHGLAQQRVHLLLHAVQLARHGPRGRGLGGRDLEAHDLAAQGLVGTLRGGLVRVDAQFRAGHADARGELPRGQVQLPGVGGGRLLHRVESRPHAGCGDGRQPAGVGHAADRGGHVLVLPVQRVAQGVRVPPVLPQRFPQAGEVLGRGAGLLVEAHGVLPGLYEGWRREEVEARQRPAQRLFHVRGQLALARGLQVGLSAGNRAPQHHGDGRAALLRNIQALVHGGLEGQQPVRTLWRLGHVTDELLLGMHNAREMQVAPRSEAIQGHPDLGRQLVRDSLVHAVLRRGRLVLPLGRRLPQRVDGIVREDPRGDAPDGAGLVGLPGQAEVGTPHRRGRSRAVGASAGGGRCVGGGLIGRHCDLEQGPRIVGTMAAAGPLAGTGAAAAEHRGPGEQQAAGRRSRRPLHSQHWGRRLVATGRLRSGTGRHEEAGPRT